MLVGVLILLFIDISDSLPLLIKMIFIVVTSIFVQWLLSKKMKFRNDNQNVHVYESQDTSKTNDYGDGDFQPNQVSTKPARMVDWAIFPMLSLEPQWGN